MYGGAGFTFSDENRVFIRDLEFLAIRGIWVKILQKECSIRV